MSLGRGTVVAKRESAAIEFQLAWVFKIHDGKIIHIQHYNSHYEALEAVGLPEG